MKAAIAPTPRTSQLPESSRREAPRDPRGSRRKSRTGRARHGRRGARPWRRDGRHGLRFDCFDRRVFPALPVGGRLADHQAACCAFSAASRSATVALFCKPSISATRLIVSASPRANPTPPARPLRGRGLLGRVDLLLGRAVGTRGAVAAERRLPPRDEVGRQRVFHLALARVQRGEASSSRCSSSRACSLDRPPASWPAPRSQPGARARPRRDPPGPR